MTSDLFYKPLFYKGEGGECRIWLKNQEKSGGLRAEAQPGYKNSNP
jgi:hypothetical protein